MFDDIVEGASHVEDTSDASSADEDLDMGGNPKPASASLRKKVGIDVNKPIITAVRQTPSPVITEVKQPVEREVAQLKRNHSIKGEVFPPGDQNQADRT